MNSYKLVGYWVVGEAGCFGEQKVGDTFQEYYDGDYNSKYWEDRGYALVPSFCNSKDVE